MTDSPLLPGAHAWRDGSGKPMPVEFYKFLRDLVAYLRASGANTADIAALEDRISVVEAGGSNATLQGLESVRVAGSLSGGLVQFRLDGDAATPGASLYYGTNALGVRGFHAMPDPTPEIPFSYITSDGEPYCTEDYADLYAGVL
ncbi:hypothetical protein [Pseudoxanthomonas koreensis]|uniref:hypothetical protein n=1 Tax=Pseudoxanthomonas koreensis TaxID=266061 RepID=UPI0013911103|nr:hypothetical protein [Pseudoxanthomonas koreensis]KAF1692647.1 hypothetical protein CSC64_06575 [Pseudoxanthomonas koreensis]